MENYIIIAILVLMVGSAVRFIWKEKKNGRKCIGCPSSGSCCKCEGASKANIKRER